MVQLKHFGNDRDYFKYDLITYLLKKRVASNYVFIPMLTKPRDDDNERKKKPKPIEGKSRELLSFIEKCDTKDLKHWKRWLKPHVKSYTTLYPVNEIFFEDDTRHQYWKKFEIILKTKNALIFIDPDIGLETGNTSYRKKMGERNIF